MSCEPLSPAQRATNAMKSTSKSIVGVVEMYEKMSNKQLFTDLEEELSSLEHAKLDVRNSNFNVVSLFSLFIFYF
jgi:hypothetical protein